MAIGYLPPVHLNITIGWYRVISQKPKKNAQEMDNDIVQ